MNRVLRFAPHVRPALLGPDCLALLGEHDETILQGRLYALVAPLVDGIRTNAEIIAALRGKATAPEVYYTITLLERSGHLAPASLAPPAEEAFWRSLGVTGDAAAGRHAGMPVTVEALAGLDSAFFCESLRAAGVRVEPGAGLRIVLVGDYLAPELGEMHRQALAEGFCWMPVKPSGAAPWMGPMFHPGGPCWDCLAFRIRAHRPVQTFLQRNATREQSSLPRPASSAGLAVAHGLAALVIARWIAGGAWAEIEHHVLVLDFERLALEKHTVQRRPQCPTCGDPGLVKRRAAQPPILERRARLAAQEGGSRVISPEETFAQYRHLISPVTGVLSSVEPVAGRDGPPWFVQGARYPMVPAADARNRTDFHAMAGGKGRSAAQARTSALCEGIERVSALYQGDEPTLRARLAELGDEGVHPHALQCFSESQYRTRDAWNTSARSHKWHVPLPFDERRVIDWTPVWSLATQQRRYLPTAYCYAQVPVAPEERFCVYSANGHASGNCLEEAILHGFFELIERDAVALWWYNRLRRPGVDLASFDDPYFDELETTYRSLGLSLRLLDITSDLGIPVLVALAPGREEGQLHAGFGCHLDVHVAAQRALTELNQAYDPAGHFPPLLDVRTLEDRSFLTPAEHTLPRTCSRAPRLREGNDLAEDVRACVNLATRANLDMLVLDQTRPDIGLCVAKVTVPGLRHFWPRFAPGRLYDVPVRMGWRNRALDEAELNPVPFLT
ncbi:TOMM precursor leader peptide-binding protein [Polyangium mundeleinium]|uniref:TOMM leader peptide-binding protein n=1 Tax=Polyangium mundeleinium TaxID=2995306 RepID=A0ABT5ETW5_9BACT|nr:TOMM precursor leader peptide-binding protein [Polyangium mundeleinium]MDC0744794.1 TOMM precursor leader peptide-binding protein [Polyangium mundeleinium]